MVQKQHYPPSLELKGRESAWCLSLLCMSSPQWKRRARVRWGVEVTRAKGEGTALPNGLTEKGKAGVNFGSV